MIVPPWSADDLEPTVALGGYAMLYALQWLVGRDPRFYTLVRGWGWPSGASRVFARQLLGGIVLGVGAVILASVLPGPLADYGARWPSLRDGVWIVGAGGPILVVVGASAASGPEDPGRPEVRVALWTVPLLIANAGFWLVYLIGYELSLRGVVLLGCARAFGDWPAIVVNLSIYLLVHLPRGARETVVSVPFGLLACLAVLDTGSVWAPLVLHGLAAVTNDSIRAWRFGRWT